MWNVFENLSIVALCVVALLAMIWVLYKLIAATEKRAR